MFQDTEFYLEDVLLDLTNTDRRKDAEYDDIVEEIEEDEEDIQEVFNPEDFISKPFLSTKCTLPEDILVFHHSFGYDCKKYYNLVLLEEKTVAFVSGNLLHFFDADTKELWFRRSAGGGGIGHITKNPNPDYGHLAVAEMGDNPFIIIYKWPSFEIVSVLREGTQKLYSHIDYSPNGVMLCSQGGEPDYLLTVWNWKKSKIILRCQSYVNDVYKASFSRFIPFHITTSGAGHIKSWEMARTFTGLKLVGSLGRFGKTEICDIIGFLSLDDGKILSGCTWGNMLLWDEGLIRAEIRRRKKQLCHSAPIVQFEFDQSGDLYSFGMDGTVRRWNFDKIDNADPPDDNRFLELEPKWELHIANANNRAAIMCAVRIYDKFSPFWYVQDGNGGIWRIDLTYKKEDRQPPVQLFVCHAGPVMDMAASPFDEHIATLGKDGRIFFYNYLEKKLLFTKKFSAEGSRLIWLPLHVDKTGTVLIAGFADGLVRVLVVSLEEFKKNPNSNSEFVTIIQVTKPHSKPITAMTMNDKGNLLVTGSEDSTVFAYRIGKGFSYITLEPIGFVNVPNSVTFLTWKPHTTSTLLVCCLTGEVVEVTLPEEPQSYTKVSFNLIQSEIKTLTFHSCKSQIRRDILLEEIEQRKIKKLEKKREELEKIKKENPGIDIDEETFLADSDSEEELEPLYFPEVPNPILFGLYTPKDTIWLSLAGYDAGYMYEFEMDKEEPVCCTMIAEADDVEIYCYLYSHNKKYLILGMQNGQIRVNRVNPDNHTDLSDYWQYSMHNNINGRIRRMCFNYDHRFMFTCGDDGNIFSYYVNFEDEGDHILSRKKPTPSFGIPTKEKVADIEDPKYLSLEETKAKAERDHKMAIANSRKEKVLKKLEALKTKFSELIVRNARLPLSQQMLRNELEIHPDITKDLDDKLQEDINLVKRKLAFNVEKSRLGLKKVQDYYLNNLDSITCFVLGIRTNVKVCTYRQTKLTQDFDDAREAANRKLEEEERKGRAHEIHAIREEVLREPERKIPLFELFLKGLPSTFEFQSNKKLQRLIERYLQRKQKQEKRQRQWDLLLKRKPDKMKNHPADVAAIEAAEESIGDYKLKSALDYKVPKHLRMSKVKKYIQLLEGKKRLFLMKKDFNDMVANLRAAKVALIERHTYFQSEMKMIHKELTAKERSYLPEIPEIDEKVEFPEKEDQLTEEDVQKLILKRDMMFEGHKTHFTLSPDDVEPVDEEYEPLLGSYYQEKEDDELQQIFANPFFSEGQNVSREQLEALTNADNSDTSWEREMKKLRMNRKMYEQEQIIREILTTTSEFDKEVKKLSDLKNKINVDAKFLELHLLTLHQEMIILEAFENVEEEVSDKVLNSIKEKHEMEVKINECNKQIDLKNLSINDLMNKIRDIQNTFQATITDNKFADFLKKIFKKKYKPPKVRSSDESESSSSSSSSSSTESDEDEASMLSEELGVVKLDENICPEGCDRELYDGTFSLRAERYCFEQELVEERKYIESAKKELDINLKKLKVIDATLKVHQDELEALQREKQQRMNEVECVVILKISQMQHFKDDSNKLENFSNTLVFSKEALKNLYARAGELDKETDLQKEKHRQNQRHLHRMNVDFQYMREMIRRLNDDITECMYRKFGGRIDLEELEESIIKRLVAEMKTSLANIKKECERTLFLMEEKLHEKQEILCTYIRENTEKLHLLTVLEEEKQSLEKLLQIQAFKLEEAVDEERDPYKSDNEKLLKAKKRQALQIQSLKNEIKILSLKTKPLPPISASTTQTKPDEILSVHSSEASIPPMPEEASVEEEEEIDWADPTGIRAILMELIESIPEKAGQITVKHILEQITQNLSTKEPSTEDTALVQEMLTNIREQSEPRGSTIDIISTVRDFVHEIISPTSGIAAGEFTYVENLLHDIIDAVQKDTGIESTFEYVVKEIIDRIQSREPTEEDTAHTEDILRAVIQGLQTSEALLDPVSAVQQILHDAINNLQIKDLPVYERETEAQEILDSIIDKLTSEEAFEEHSENVKKILNDIIMSISSEGLSIEGSDELMELIDNTVAEIENREDKDDVVQVKEILEHAITIAIRETSKEIIPDLEVADTEETVQEATDDIYKRD
ncbi:cilia- and flagella-associated protein 44 [Periplaneta americana]|uniref:cilia- and flagella-associated protein 44 n=1 Tax=Periplaneta americana TaxID=6978 RepID=UPI0037E70BF5